MSQQILRAENLLDRRYWKLKTGRRKKGKARETRSFFEIGFMQCYFFAFIRGIYKKMGVSVRNDQHNSLARAGCRLESISDWIVFATHSRNMASLNSNLYLASSTVKL